MGWWIKWVRESVYDQRRGLLEGTNVDTIAARPVTIRHAREGRTTLTKLRCAAATAHCCRVACINGRTVGQQLVGWRRAAIIGKAAEPRINRRRARADQIP